MFSFARHRLPRRRMLIQSSGSGVLAGIAVGAIVILSGVILPTQSATADTSSAVTVTAATQDPDLSTAPLPRLSVTVSQTKDLLAQGIQVSWTGGKLSTPPSANASGGADFLQIMQCWGDDKNNPGQPDRTTCQYGGLASPGDTRYTNTTADTVTAAQDAPFATPISHLFGGYTSIPFASATGVTVADVVDGKRVDGVNEPGNNQFFTKLTTNEIAWAGSGANGTGSVKFEVQTAAQAPGLGCGAATTTAGVTTGAACWLVILPRGESEPNSMTPGIKDSGLLWDSWKHKLAVRINFQPIGSRCAIGTAERQLAGSELVAEAVRSWQPQLCSTAGGAAYTLINEAEPDAALAANDTAAQPLALTSRALQTDGQDDLAYAPIALTGLAITFAVDRRVKTDGDIPADVSAQNHLPFTALKLTPRLVAKLLTNSYWESLPTGIPLPEIGYQSFAKPGKNARNLTSDPDFLQINDPEWAYQAIVDPSVADLLTPQGRSDGAWALWSYVMSDKDAVAFLSGKPDPWGMTVNSRANTDEAQNPSGTGLTLPTASFPKPDPVAAPGIAGAPEIDSVTYRPYTNDYDTSALLTLRGDGQLLGAVDPLAIPPKYAKSQRKAPGQQAVLGLSDSASAAKYQLYTAQLQNSAGKYVAPTVDSFTAAAAAMTPDPTQGQVYGLANGSAEAKAAPTAYPLTMPVYAAVNPAMTDSSATDKTALRKDYAAFIRYAVDGGQDPGTGLGQLPAGFAPIPAGWKSQALSAATTIEQGFAGPAPTSTATPAGPATSANQPSTVTSSGSSQLAANQYVAQAAASPASVAVASVPDPSPSGTAAAPLLGSATPADANLGPLSAAVPASILAAIGTALAVPFVSRIRRRQ